MFIIFIIFIFIFIVVVIGTTQGWVATPHRRPLLPTVEELGYWQLGEVLAGQFSPGSGVASPIREALVSGRLQYCPRQVCPVASEEIEFWRCLSVMKVDCSGDEPLGYVVTDAGLYDPNAVGRRDMDRWIANHFELEGPRDATTILVFSQD